MFAAHGHGNRNLIFDLRHPMQHQSEFLTKHASLPLLVRRLNIIFKHEEDVPGRLVVLLKHACLGVCGSSLGLTSKHYKTRYHPQH